MVMQYIQRRRHRGGQYIAFEGNNNKNSTNTSTNKKKTTWRKCNRKEIIQQMMAAEGTDTTALMDSSRDECDSMDSSVGSCDDTKSVPTEKRPSWLKRPMFADICSNHAMVNAERQWGNLNLHPLKRSRELDELAREHAQVMASASLAFHADPNEVLAKLATKPNVRLGENVAKGTSGLRDLHNEMKKKSSNYSNIMDNRYEEFGIGTARDANGDLFLCQIYRG